MSKRHIANEIGSNTKRFRFEEDPTTIQDPQERQDPAPVNETVHFHEERLLGLGSTNRSLNPRPLSFVTETERMDPSDLVGNGIHSPLNSLPFLSGRPLTSYYYRLLLDASHKSLLDEELVRTRHLNMLQRDYLLSPDDIAALSWAQAYRLAPFLEPSIQHEYHGAPVSASARSKRASWLDGSSADTLVETPLHTAGPSFLAFQDKQVSSSLQARLLATKNEYIRRSHGLGPTSRVEALLLQRGLYPGGLEKVPRHAAPRVDAPEKGSPLQEAHHETSDGNKERTHKTHFRLPLPMGADNKKYPHFSERVCVSLATDEDPNWLSEFLCFVRSDIVEVFRASEEDVKCRNNTKKVNHGQVGIRCRFCAHVSSTSRTRRSSSFPFTLSRIYQSLTMMLRDHFGQCPCIPDPIKERYVRLKGKTPQGASGSNQYWESSASKLGLIDSPLGIWVKEGSDSQGKRSSHGDNRDKNVQSNKSLIPTVDSTVPSVLAQKPAPLLVKPTDQTLVSDFLYELMTHVQLVHLDETERIGNRKNLQVDMPGLGCRYCCSRNRKGLCRTFPARRRNLSQKLSDLYEHIRRCSLCPKEQREKLIALNKHREDARNKREKTTTKAGDTDFLDRLWESMRATRTNTPTHS